MPKVYGGQAFKPVSFPPTKYIDSLLKAYAPELHFSPELFKQALRQARKGRSGSAFDKAFAEVTSDGASCGQQLCWCLLDIEPGNTLPLHAHKNLELAYVMTGCMRERAISALIPLERIAEQYEVDWMDCPPEATVIDCSFATGEVWLGLPGSVHQVYTSKSNGSCMLLMLYSKDCTFIRAATPTIARQLLPATTDNGTTYHSAPVARTPSSFCSRDPMYAKYRAAGATSRTQNMTVAQVAVKALSDCGVRDTILYPGAKCVELLKVVDSNHYGVRGWLCRNEHAGAFIAEGYNKSQGQRLCALMTTSGPGATNLCTGIASAWRDGVPMIVITSQVPTYKVGTAAFQEVPVCDMYKPITKGAFYISSASQVYDTIVSACRLAVEGVNGPVLVDIPEDLQAEKVALPQRRVVEVPPLVPAAAAGSSPGKAIAPLQTPSSDLLASRPLNIRSHVACPISQSIMKQVLGYIRVARRPILLLGGGCVRIDEVMLNELVDVLDMPVVYTFMGKGCISDDHELCLGPIGVHGLYTANTAVANCDMVLALGCRFDERAACKSFELWDSPKTVVHVDIVEQRVMSGSLKNHITCNVVADVEDFVGVLLQHLYGFIETRRKTFMMAAPSLATEFKALELKPSCKLTELDEMEPFLTDPAELQQLRDMFADRQEDADACACEGTPANGLAEGQEPSSPKHVTFAAGGPFANHAADVNGGLAADAHGANLDQATSLATTMSDFSGAEWHMYSGWSREMSELKTRRWRSMMPIAAGPKTELTTREMIHVTDSFLSFRGLQPIVCSDVGSHLCLLAQYMRLHHPRQWLMEGGLASMGCGLPSAIGAAMANPQATCLAVCGDGGFAMTSQELMMAKVYKLNVKVIVTVNNRLQLVEQLEEEVYDSLDVFTFLGDPEHPHRPYPNFAKLAEAYGVPSVTAWNRQELLDALSLMFANPGPFLLEVVALAERPHIRYWTDNEQ